MHNPPHSLFLRNLVFIFFFIFSLGNIGSLNISRWLPNLGPANVAWLMLAFLFIILIMAARMPVVFASNRQVNIYLFIFLALTFTSFLFPVLSGNIEIGTMLSHAMVFFVILSLSTILPKTGLAPLLWGIFLGAQITHLMDWLAFLTNSPINRKSDSLGLGYAGIGIPVGFGEHGLILLWGFFAGIALIFKEGRGLLFRSTLIVILIGMATMIFFSQSRSSIAALLLGLVILLILYPYKSSLNRLTIRILSIPIGATFLSAIFFIHESRSRTLNLRFAQFKKVFEVVSEKPFTGIGWNVWYPNYDSLVIHNAFLNYLAAGGYIPFIIYMLLLLFTASCFLHYTITSKDRKEKVTLIILFSIFCATVLEISLFKSTPSAALAVSGLTIVIYRYIREPKRGYLPHLD